MSYKELITNINFVNKFEEHRFTVGRGIALLIFHKKSTYFPSNCISLTDKCTLKKENLNCGFSHRAISIICDLYRL